MTSPRRVPTEVERTAGHVHLDRRDRPRIIIDPATRFGRPFVEGKGVATVDVAGMVAAGETVATVAYEYDLTRHEVLLACWHEGMDGSYQAVWGDWATAIHAQLGGWKPLDVGALPDPPVLAAPRRRWWHRLTRALAGRWLYVLTPGFLGELFNDIWSHTRHRLTRRNP